MRFGAPTKITLALIYLLFGQQLLAQPLAEAPICYVPGAGGGSPDAMKKFPAALKERGIEMIPFQVGFKGSVEVRAARLVKGLEEILETKPDFRCHMFAFSMGGVLTRYVWHHLKIQHPSRGEISLSDILLSITTFSSPHLGTSFASWLRKYAPGVDSGLNELAEEKMAAYMSPDHPAKYSPAPTEVPVFSFRTYIEKAAETSGILGKLGYTYMADDARKRGLDPRNDGVVPFRSQALGKVRLDLKIQHEFFTADIGVRPWAPDFYESHWRYLVGQVTEEEAPEQLRDLQEKLPLPKQPEGPSPLSAHFNPFGELALF